MASKIPQWTDEDIKRLETALVQSSVDSIPSVEDIAELLQKPLEEVNYYLLVSGIDEEIVDSGNFDDNVSLGEASQSKHEAKDKEKRPYRHWTDEEHKLFLLGLEKCGKGYWECISSEYVKTRTHTQVASHAQYYFKSQAKAGPSG